MDTAKSVAASFPMVQLIDEVVKTSIPSQPSGLLRILTGCFVAHRSKTTAGFSLFASRIQSKFAAAPLPQSLTWCTSGQSARGSKTQKTHYESLLSACHTDGFRRLRTGKDTETVTAPDPKLCGLAAAIYETDEKHNKPMLH